jgi:hypothetical protein
VSVASKKSNKSVKERKKKSEKRNKREVERGCVVDSVIKSFISESSCLWCTE